MAPISHFGAPSREGLLFFFTRLRRKRNSLHAQAIRRYTYKLRVRVAEALLLEKSLHREAALEQDNSQWTGENRLLEPEEIVILDEKEREQLNRQHHTSLFVTMIMNNLI
jgi:hypothetical protein